MPPIDWNEYERAYRTASRREGGKVISRRHAVDAAVDQAHHGHVREVVDDVEAAVVLVQAEEVVQGETQRLAEDDPVDPGVGHNDEGFLKVLGDELVKPGQDPGTHVQEAFAPGNPEAGEVPEPGLEFGGVALGNLGEAQAFPGPEMNLPELRDVRRQVTPRLMISAPIKARLRSEA